MKLRKLAISIAEERVSDIRSDADGDWSFDLMRRDGRAITFMYKSELSAHNHRAIKCLGIAADFLRLDIRKRLDEFDHIIMNGDHCPDETPHLGAWWKWLQYRGEVPRIPGGKNYFDVRQFQVKIIQDSVLWIDQARGRSPVVTDFTSNLMSPKRIHV